MRPISRSDPLSGRLPDRSPTPTSSQTPPADDDFSSLQDGHLTMHDRHRGSKRDRGRHSANRKFMEMLVSEELEAKQTPNDDGKDKLLMYLLFRTTTLILIYIHVDRFQ